MHANEEPGEQLDLFEEKLDNIICEDNAQPRS